MILAGVDVRPEHVQLLANLLEGDELAAKLERALEHHNNIVSLTQADRNQIVAVLHDPPGELRWLRNELVKQHAKLKQRDRRDDNLRERQRRSAFRPSSGRALPPPDTQPTEATVSETTGTENIGEPDPRDDEREDPSTAGSPEVVASPEDAQAAYGDEPAAAPSDQSGRREEREQRQHATQQHGDTFAVESEGPTDTSGVEQGSAPDIVAAQPDKEPSGEGASRTDDR